MIGQIMTSFVVMQFPLYVLLFSAKKLLWLQWELQGILNSLLLNHILFSILIGPLSSTLPSLLTDGPVSPEARISSLTQSIKNKRTHTTKMSFWRASQILVWS